MADNDRIARHLYDNTELGREVRELVNTMTGGPDAMARAMYNNFERRMEEDIKRQNETPEERRQREDKERIEAERKRQQSIKISKEREIQEQALAKERARKEKETTEKEQKKIIGRTTAVVLVLISVAIVFSLVGVGFGVLAIFCTAPFWVVFFIAWYGCYRPQTWFCFVVSVLISLILFIAACIGAVSAGCIFSSITFLAANILALIYDSAYEL